MTWQAVQQYIFSWMTHAALIAHIQSYICTFNLDVDRRICWYDWTWWVKIIWFKCPHPHDSSREQSRWLSWWSRHHGFQCPHQVIHFTQFYKILSLSKVSEKQNMYLMYFVVYERERFMLTKINKYCSCLLLYQLTLSKPNCA